MAKEELICKGCKVSFVSNTCAHRKYCTKLCYHKYNRGNKHVNWAGGEWFEKSKGYMQRSDEKGGRRPEHILIAEKAMGKKLPKGYVVHHINGDKTDNRNKNLLVCSKAYHTALHHRMSLLYAKEHFGENHG